MRWHESHCRASAVQHSGGTLTCRNCFAIVTTASAPALDTSSGSLATEKTHTLGIRHNLLWPEQVEYTHDAVQSGTSSTPSAGKAPSELAPREKEVDEPGPYDKLSGASNFRLLRLNPGKLDEPLHGEIMVVGLQEDHSKHEVEYECVSYTAANAVDNLQAATIYVGEFWDALSIKTSCETALRQLRLEKSSRLLWVDSVCINQQDDTERSQQLSIIVPIFAQAAQVIAYLGDSNEAQRFVFDCLHKISTPDCTLVLGQGSLETCTMAQRAAHDRALYFMREFFSNTRYFHRVWTALEFIVAPSILFQSGSDKAHWPATGLELDSEGPSDLPEWASYRGNRANVSERDLLPLLQSLRSSGCSDPRDRLFCVLNLVRSWDDEAMTPHYGLSTEEVYIGIAAYLTQKQNASKDVLSLAGRAKHRLTRLRLPSWVPDWDNLQLSNPYWNYTPYIDYPRGLYGQSPSPKMHILRCELESDGPGLPLPICSTSGALRISAALQSRPDTKGAFRVSEGSMHSQDLTLETTWRGAVFTATWQLPIGEPGLVQDGDKLAWLAGQFTILRPCDEFSDRSPASFELIHSLGRGLNLKCMPPALPNFSMGTGTGLDADLDEDLEEEDLDADLGDNVTLETSWNDPLIHRQIFFDNIDSLDKAVTLQDRAMSQENQLRVITTNSNLQTRPGSNVDGLDPIDSQVASNPHERYIPSRDRLLSLALYVRLGWFDVETTCWNYFVNARMEYKLHDALGSRFLALKGNQRSLLAESIEQQLPRERISAWAAALSLATGLDGLSLPSSLPEWRPLLTALINWIRAMERLLLYLSTQGQELDAIWDSGGAGLGDQGELASPRICRHWVGHWQRYGLEPGPDANASESRCEVLLVLEHVIRLAKASIGKIPDYDNIGLAEVDRVMTARAAPLQLVSNMEWAHASGKEVDGLEGFAGDMAIRLAVLPLGLDLDDKQVVNIV